MMMAAAFSSLTERPPLVLLGSSSGISLNVQSVDNASMLRIGELYFQMCSIADLFPHSFEVPFFVTSFKLPRFMSIFDIYMMS